MHQPDLFKDGDSPPKAKPQPKEFKVVALRDCPTPMELLLCDTPQRAADYWRLHIETHPHFDPERECLAVLLLNTRFRVKGHHLISTGTLDTLLVHSREVFRAGQLLKINVLDHVVVGRPGHRSLRELGCFNQ